MIRTGDIFQARILVVDDEPVNVRLLERMLQSAGYSALKCTTDSSTVMSLVEEFQPDVILLDLHMPDPDGFAVLEALEAACPAGEYLPVLVLTADSTQAARHRALSGGAKDFVTKPFDRTEVLARTQNLLKTRLLHKALRQANTALEERLIHQAFHDPLTGLSNRVLLHERISHALARIARGGHATVLFLDLDDFKSVNDTLGHAEGDRLLEVVATRLLQATRGCDTVARMGGDEFGILLEGLAQPADVMQFVERITESLRRPAVLQGREVLIGASIGVAHVAVGQEVDEILRNADLAMYRAKATGRGGHQVFEPGMYTEVLERLELESDLRRALTGDELRLVYQPIIDLESGRPSGVEALLRWQHPSRGMVPPLAFVAMAEETGLIVPVGRWVLQEACRQARRWQLDAGDANAPTVSVNVSGRQLMEPSIVDDVKAALADSGLDAGLLTLEITESVLMQDAESTLATLHALKAVGIRVAIDDFGTGYSSLSYLRRFPIDVLKIDKAFVDGVAHGGSDAVLARTIVTLASMLELSTVAEGVERGDQHAQLVAFGCSRGQGYHYSHPLGAEDIRVLLQQAEPLEAPLSREMIHA